MSVSRHGAAPEGASKPDRVRSRGQERTCVQLGGDVASPHPAIASAAVAAVDVQPDKLGLAKRLGSAHTVDASAIDPAQAIPGGGADVAITLAVQPNLIEGAFALAAPSWSVRVRLAAEGLSARGADR